VIGRPIRLDGRLYDIAGVTQAGFFGVDVGRSFDVALPICAEPLVNGAGSLVKMPVGWFLASIGRLKPGVSIDQATAQLHAISPSLFRDTLPTSYNEAERKTYLGFKLAAFEASSGVSTIRRTYDTPLWILLATTGLVLLIACANLANLMLARATAREREIAVRLAIGASRPRIIRQLMSESLLLAAAGAVAGALLAQWMCGFLISFLTTNVNQMFVALEADWRVVGFAAALALTTCLLFGLAPALRATHAAPASAMKAGTRSVTERRERFGLRRALVVVQVALSLVLMAGAFLFVRSLSNLRGSELGFDARGLLTASVDLRSMNVPEDRRVDFFREMRERLAGTPGIVGAAQAEILPISGAGWNQVILIDGTVQESYPNFNRVSPGFFKLMGTPLVSGREFTDNDRTGAPPVAIVNESMARTFFKGESPIGRTFQIEEPPGAPRPHYQIVGVVRDTKYRDLREPAGPIAYLPSGQEAAPPTYAQFILRVQGPLGTAWTGIAKTLAQINPTIGVQIQTMEVQIHNTLMPERLMATLSGFFGALAALIATIGLYGVMSYMVTRRKTEIGIRMALGANASTVIRMVMGESAILVGVGLVAGTVLAVYGARQASTLLFGLKPGDPATLAMSIGALGVVAIMASYVPAYRASRVDPTIALREE
jgi:predicted permease